MFLLLIVVIVLSAVASDDRQYTALHFGASTNDYIAFKYNMAPFQDSFSICTWIKRVDTSADYPFVFDYEPGNEIHISSNGVYNHFLGDGDLNGKQSVFTTPVGSWFNYCITWSLASRSTNLYLDGNLIGTGTTDSGRTLKMGGTLYFNQLHTSSLSGFIFGGQFYQFNIFSKALSSADVKKIADGGMCLDLTEFSGTGDLRWEYILSQSRSGSVREVEIDIYNDMECLKTLLRRSQERLTNVTGRLNETESQLSWTVVKLNTTLKELGDVRGKLERTESELQIESAQHNKTGEQLDTCSTSLTNTLTQLETARTFHNITRWDVLYTTPYFNKVLTEELFQQLSSSWGMLGKFVGVNITEGVVNHFSQYHREPVCDVFEQMSIPMLRQFVGVEWTTGIADHLRDTHVVSREDSPCDSDTES
ncbi:uncharacterized protein LOC134818606 isoform X2 [Bolinopsis microptera]|uniref:uncharacterized protein LOC134818606 isoform X2 n=1 Tax=Bolinopsis microptera TaxID=2820187 RepID=UPI003078F9E2